MSPASPAPATPPSSARPASRAETEALPCLLAQTVRVYLEDTDAGGIVYHASWLRFFERARTDWLRTFGIEQSTFGTAAEVNFVVSDMQIEFIRPGRLDQLVRTELRLLEARKASLTLHQRACCVSSGQALATAHVRLAATRRSDARPIGLPAQLIAHLKTSRPYNLPN